MKRDLEPSPEPETMQQQRLRKLVHEVANQEGFTIERLPANFERYYRESLNNGHRCVDGRKVLEKYADGQPTGYQSQDYLGDQLPGGTFGLIGALRVITGFDEEKARGIVKKACQTSGQRMGDHIDDDHGRIQIKEELKKRSHGCGNQDAIADGKLKMYKRLRVDRAIIDGRIAWMRKNGALPVLTGNHEEKLAAVNLKEGLTFNTSEAVENNESIFNVDLQAAWEIAGYLFDVLSGEKGERQSLSEREKFQEAITMEVVKDYMQTLVALRHPEKKLFVHADSQIQV